MKRKKLRKALLVAEAVMLVLRLAVLIRKTYLRGKR